MKAEVVQVIQQLFCAGRPFSLSDDDSLLENGLVDSLGVMELVKALEANFGIRVAPAELSPDNLDSVANIAAYLKRKGAGK
jgi:acyl carrier protein